VFIRPHNEAWWVRSQSQMEWLSIYTLHNHNVISITWSKHKLSSKHLRWPLTQLAAGSLQHCHEVVTPGITTTKMYILRIAWIQNEPSLHSYRFSQLVWLISWNRNYILKTLRSYGKTVLQFSTTLWLTCKSSYLSQNSSLMWQN